MPDLFTEWDYVMLYEVILEQADVLIQLHGNLRLN